jgi:hypothetical protein
MFLLLTSNLLLCVVKERLRIMFYDARIISLKKHFFTKRNTR